MRKGLHAMNLMRFAAGSYRPIIGPAKVTWQVGDIAPDQAREIIRDLAECGTLQVSFSGDGAFLRPDIFGLIGLASDMGLSTSADINGSVITNRRNELLDSSLGTLNIHGTFEGMQFIRQNRCGNKLHLSANITITPDNCSDLSDMARLAMERGADGVTFHISGRRYTRQLEEQIGIIERDYLQFVQQPAEYLDGMVSYIRNPEKLYRYKCVAGYCTALIKPNGEACACPDGDFPLGNLNEASFRDIWFSDRADQARKEIHEDRHPICWSHSVAPLTILAAYLRPIKMPKLLNPAVFRHEM